MRESAHSNDTTAPPSGEEVYCTEGFAGRAENWLCAADLRPERQLPLCVTDQRIEGEPQAGGLLQSGTQPIHADESRGDRRRGER